MHPCIKENAIFVHMFGSASLNDPLLTTKESCKMQSWPFDEPGSIIPGRWLDDGQQGGGGCVRDVGDQLLITLDTQLTILTTSMSPHNSPLGYGAPFSLSTTCLHTIFARP